jgi:hypothetical protein
VAGRSPVLSFVTAAVTAAVNGIPRSRTGHAEPWHVER